MKTVIKKPTGAELRDKIDIEIKEIDASILSAQMKLVNGLHTLGFIAVIKLKDEIELLRRKRKSLELKWSRVEL